jgi:hypothetical protein
VSSEPAAALPASERHLAKEAITAGFRERIETLARAMSFGHLLLLALLMAVLAVGNGYNALYGTLSSFSGIIDHRNAQVLVLSASIVLGLASAYFLYLAVLKTKLARDQRNRDGARE